MGAIQADAIRLILEIEKIDWAEEFIQKCSIYFSTLFNVKEE
jgi:hypothetical protein